MTGKIAIVGAGPAGCYVAQALLKAQPDLAVDVMDKLPVPYGLLRYGVAADHQGTKNLSRQFSRVFERQGARFFGNVQIGRDVTLEALRDAYDAVVLTAGLSGDRSLSIPGADLPGVFGSGELTRALNEHPDAAPLPDIGSNPLIVGNGNVAIDLLRVLCKTPDELAGSDLGSAPSAWLANNRLQSITIVGRSPAARAKFDPVMIHELGKLKNVNINVVDAGDADDDKGRERLDALASISGTDNGAITLTFRFELTPLSVEGETRVTGLRVRGAKGVQTIDASSIITAIGFESNGDLQRDDLIGSIDQKDTGKLAERVYAAGWFLHGASGTIPHHRPLAQDTAALVLREMSPDPQRIGSALFDGLSQVVDYEGWQRIDAFETQQCPANRCRQKIPSSLDLIKIAAKRDQAT